MANNLPSIIVKSENDINSNNICFFISLFEENKKLKIYFVKHSIINDAFLFEKYLYQLISLILLEKIFLLKVIMLHVK